MSIQALLNIAGQALAAQQQALRTTGHNLSNADTAGFSRQRVEFGSAPPDVGADFSLGRGVQTSGVRRAVDRFLEDRLLGAHGEAGFSQAENRALNRIADVFPIEEGSGLSAALDAFFGAFSDLAQNPASQSERVALMGRATVLVQTFQDTRARLTATQSGLDKDLKSAVQILNGLLPRVAELNVQIVADEVGGGQANDLRDQRQKLLQDIADFADITTREGADGQVSVEMNGLLLVSNDRAITLTTTLDPASNQHKIASLGPGGNTTDITSFFDRGEIGATIQARDVSVPAVIDQLDQLAFAVANEVNTQHTLGFDLNGTAGGNFFDVAPAPLAPLPAYDSAAAKIKIDLTLAGDSRLIAAAQEATGVPGDNRNALAMAGLYNTEFVSLGNLTFQSSFINILADIGEKVQTSESRLAFHQDLLTQAESRREVVSGVNMDEELSNLIKFQRAFEAAARLVQTGDEMYQSVLAMVG